LTRSRHLATIFILLALCARPQVLDRIAVLVDGQPILQSEIDDAAWFARLSAHASCAAPLGAAELRTAREHLIDDQLLSAARSAAGFPTASPELVETQVEMLRQRAGGDPAWTDQLLACHLDGATVFDLVERQLTLLAFLDQHFSDAPEAEAAIDSYYKEIFVPQARARNLAPAPLDDVRATIATLLRQQQRSSDEAAWLKELRAAARIEIKGGG